MRAAQLLSVCMSRLDQTKRIKFQNSGGWESQTMAVNAIIERGNCYIMIWACHPKLIKQDMKEGDKLTWYNPNCSNSSLVNKYFPDYQPLK